MEKTTFDECFGYMARFHKLEPSATVRDAWWVAFQQEHDEIFCKATMLHNDKQRPGLFPTLERFRGYITDAREKAWESKKAAEPRRPLTDYRPPAGDRRNMERGVESLALATAVAKQGYSDETVKALRERWPAIDWEAERAAANKIREKKWEN